MWNQSDYLPDVVDATAGLEGMPLFLPPWAVACGLLERNPVVAALLDDGLARGYADAEIGPGYRSVCG